MVLLRKQEQAKKTKFGRKLVKARGHALHDSSKQFHNSNNINRVQVEVLSKFQREIEYQVILTETIKGMSFTSIELHLEIRQEKIII